MATQTIIKVVDDYDSTRTTDVRTEKITVFGTAYEVDLSSESRAELAAVLEPFLAVARKSGSRRAARRGVRYSTDLDISAVRAWALENGYPVGTRGSLPDEVIRAYEDHLATQEDEVSPSE